MRPVVFVEQRNDAPLADSLGIISHLAAAGISVSAIYTAAAADDAAIDQIARSGAAQILIAQNADFVSFPIEPRAELLARLCGDHDFDTVIFSTTVLASDLAGRVAAMLDAGIGWGITGLSEVAGVLVGSRPILSDTLMVEMEWTSRIRILLIRPNCFDPAAFSPDAKIIPIEAGIFSGVRQAARTELGVAPAIATARIIVSGGRGLGKAENLQLIRDLANSLDAAVGVSLPVVEAGWAPRSMQVGQTGTVVRPILYIACGISGQFQHKVGIERSSTIVAINTDRNAPIMGFCDLAVIGDLTELLPRLIKLIKEKKA